MKDSFSGVVDTSKNHSAVSTLTEHSKTVKASVTSVVDTGGKLFTPIIKTVNVLVCFIGVVVTTTESP
jgi:hypothetical protein